MQSLTSWIFVSLSVVALTSHLNLFGTEICSSSLECFLCICGYRVDSVRDTTPEKEQNWEACKGELVEKSIFQVDVIA